jgi:hypothetical protein
MLMTDLAGHGLDWKVVKNEEEDGWMDGWMDGKGRDWIWYLIKKEMGRMRAGGGIKEQIGALPRLKLKYLEWRGGDFDGGSRTSCSLNMAAFGSLGFWHVQFMDHRCNAKSSSIANPRTNTS